MKLLIFIAFAPMVIMTITIICIITYSSNKTVVLETPKHLQEEGPGNPHFIPISGDELDTQLPVDFMKPEPWYANPPMNDIPISHVPEQKPIIIKQGLSINDIMKYELLDHIWR